MFAYLLLLAAVASRILPHAGWMNFTLVGGALLYFGARRSWREMLVPLALLMATDYYLTVHAYHYAFQWLGYATLASWTWYAMAMARDGFCCTRGLRLRGLPQERSWDRHRFLWFRTTLCGPVALCIRTRWRGWQPATRLQSRSIATIWPRRPSCWRWHLAFRCWCGA